MADTENRVEVEIYNEFYTLKGDASPEYLMMVAQYVDKQMRQAVARNAKLSITKAAVLAAINIADEYYKLQEDYNNLVKMLEPDKI